MTGPDDTTERAAARRRHPTAGIAETPLNRPRTAAHTSPSSSGTGDPAPSAEATTALATMALA